MADDNIKREEDDMDEEEVDENVSPLGISASIGVAVCAWKALN